MRLLNRPFRRSYSTAFSCIQKRQLPSIKATAFQYTHPLGTQWVHVHSENLNNVFNVSFLTDPADSTGVPHILEHTTLCGSKNYPIRDPFFKMTNRSMATFMNALTGDDMTMYPFSSQNKKDYFNLMDVYLDSVFNPLLNRLDFFQEGWRLEHENVNDPSSPIIFKGVVYNEMKGALADINSLYYTRHQQYLYPGTTYSFVSGGDPPNITDLNHKDLVAFHGKHYHPSNARIVTYGNFDLQEQMMRVEDKIKHFKPLNQLHLKDVERWDKPRKVVLDGPLDTMMDSEKQSRIAVSYLTNPDADTFESVTLKVISDLLLDGAASPMYKALIESKLGSDFGPTTGFNPYALTTSMSFGLQGVETSNLLTAEERILECLEQTVKNGFPKERIQSVFHQIELGLKHKTTKYGMNLTWSIVRNLIHGADPLDAIDSEKHLSLLSQKIKQPGFLESKIKQYFLENNHRLTFVMNPSPTYTNDLVLEEKQRLASKVSKLTPESKAEIYENGIELARLQETKEDLSCLPCLPLSDVSRIPQWHDTHQTNEGVPVHWRETDTNDVSYTYMKFDVTHLPLDMKLHLPLFCRALTSLGTESQSLAAFDEEIRMFTGGISVHCYSTANPTSTSDSQSYIIVSSNSLTKNIPDMYRLLHDCLHSTNWTAYKELWTCLVGEATDFSNSITGEGHLYAMKASAAGLSPNARDTELFSGMRQVEFLKTLTEREDDMSHVAQTLKDISKSVLTQLVDFLVVCEKSQQSKHHQHIQTLIKSFDIQPRTNQISETFSPVVGPVNYAMDLGVNFTAKTFMGVPYSHPDSGPLRVLSSVLTNHYLHRELREKGGAYGGGSRYSGLDGVFHFMTYRDPLGFQRTFDTFESCIDNIDQLMKSIDEKAMEQAKLDILKGLDSPINAGREGLTQYQTGISYDMLQRNRESIFDCTVDDLVRVAGLYLKGPNNQCVIGEKVN
ncbi:peptidase M16C associated-domain-containing protein [Globomyces pollinis-pini]|nr:peptidase M16C associated-domain-containing protein [Globomyces pollinis-pini]